MKQPKISIIVPVYNAEKYLRHCLDSILNQSFQDFELLLVDDGSKDRSGKICDEYAEKDKRVSVWHQENQGVSVARNVGLEHAQGEWIYFPDSDDIVIENALEIMMKMCVEDIDYVMCGYEVYDENGNQFAYLDLYTPFGIIEATIWSSQLKEYSDDVKKGNCLAILGRKREEHFFVEKIKPYNTWLEQMRKKGVAV